PQRLVDAYSCSCSIVARVWSKQADCVKKCLAVRSFVGSIDLDKVGNCDTHTYLGIWSVASIRVEWAREVSSPDDEKVVGSRYEIYSSEPRIFGERASVFAVAQ